VNDRRLTPALGEGAAGATDPILVNRLAEKASDGAAAQFAGFSPSSYARRGHASQAGGPLVPKMIGFMMVSPALPGASLAVADQKVTVQGYPLATAGEREAIDVEITRAPESVEGANASPGRAGKRSRQVAGFSEEEALFRMRWGWAAADQAKRAARENATGL
jgi:hypothetical protein